jgi:cytochrome P450 family 6
LFPPIFHIIRKASNDYKIPNSDIIVPKNTHVLIPAYSIHRDPEYYPDPEKFDPIRFSDENKAKRHPMAYLPFGAGNRSCIGFRFGLMQIKIAIIQLLLNFKIFTNDKTPNPMRLNPRNPILTSTTDMWLTFERIQRDL